MTNPINDSEILEYVRAFPDATFSEVARALNIDRDKVSSVAHKNGIYRQPRGTGMTRRRGKLPVPRKHADLESERKVVDYIKSHPKESYSVMGKRFGYSPGRLSQIARDNGIIHYARRGEGEKTRRKIAKFLRKHPDMKVEDIAKILGYSAAYVSTVAGKSGLRRQAPRGSGFSILGRVVRGNLTNKGAPSGMSGNCTTEGLSATATTQNQLAGIGLVYDPAGNVVNDGLGNTPTYDAENRIVTAAGVNYYYDGDGVRINKSSGTMYWPGPSGTFTETTLAGTINEEYVYFNGERIARVDRPSGTANYYFSDMLGSASVIASPVGAVQEQYFYFPYGGTRSSSGSDPNHYKFTGKERDAESGLDMFGARYYGSSLGRFMTPDWAAKPTNVPYASFGNPQSLNLYSYVNNNPTTTRDPDGHVAGVDDLVIGGIIVSAMAVAYLESPPGQQMLRNAASSITSLGSSISSFFHPDNSGQNAAPPPTLPTNVSQGTPGTTATNVATGTPASTSQQGAVDASAMQQAGPNYAGNNIVQGSGRVNSDLPGGQAEAGQKFGNSLPVKVRVLTPRQVILWLTTALDFEIMLTERRESIDQQVSREDSMKQSTSTSPKNQTSRTNSRSVGEFFSGPIESVYVNSLPPRGRYMHGSSVEFFFENGELAVRGDIIQIAPKEEAFYLALDRTLGLDYWRSELVQRQGEPVIRATNLATDWRNQGLEAVLLGPRDVRFYTKDGPEITRGRVAAVEIIAKRAPKQRVLLVASEDDPGDVAVITPSDDYDKKVSKLVALEDPKNFMVASESRHGD